MAKIKAPVAKPTRSELVDHLGDLKEQMKALQVEHDALEAMLRKRLGGCTGENYTLTVFDVVGKTFNWTKAKKLLGSAYDKCWTTNEYRSSRVTSVD